MKKRNLVITAVLLLLTALIAFFYLKDRSQPPRGNLIILDQGREIPVDPFTLPLSEVKGTTVNGKGEEKEISGKGVSVRDVLALAGIDDGNYTSIRVISSDEYAAGLQAEEIASGKTTFLIRDPAEDGTEKIRLIVFGDSGSKRQVKDVERIEVIK